VEISERVIEFCPDVQGECIGEGCAAFHRGLMVTVNDGGKFVSKVCSDVQLSSPFPIMFTLDTNACSKYGGFIDEESLELYLKFAKDFGES